MQRARVVALISLTAMVLLEACTEDVRYRGGFKFDVLPPTVVTVVPATSANGVDLLPSIDVVFSEEVERATVTSAAFFIERGGELVDSEVVAAPSGTSANLAVGEELAYLTTYQVRLNGGITDLVGHSLEPFDSDFTTRDLSWVAGSVISQNEGGGVFPPRTPRIVVTSSTSLVVLWSQSGGVMAADYDLSDGWSGITPVADGTQSTSFAAASDAKGTLVVVWTEFDGMRNNVWARFRSAQGWGAAQEIESDPGNATSPHVSMNESGIAHAVWRQTDGTRFNIWSARYSGGTWGAPALVENDNTANADEPIIAVSPDGTATAVFRQYDGVRVNLRANRYVGSGGWGIPPFASFLETDNTGDVANHAVAAFPDSSVAVVWAQTVAGTTSIYSSRFAGISWSGAELLEAEPGNARLPSIATDPFGNAVATWAQSIGTADAARSNRFSAGAWDGAVTLSTNDVGSIGGDVTVALDERGNGYALWTHGYSLDYRVVGARYLATGWSAPTCPVAPTIETVQAAAIAMFPNGRAIAAWDTYDIRHRVAVSAFR